MCGRVGTVSPCCHSLTLAGFQQSGRVQIFWMVPRIWHSLLVCRESQFLSKSRWLFALKEYFLTLGLQLIYRAANNRNVF